MAYYSFIKQAMVTHIPFPQSPLTILKELSFTYKLALLTGSTHTCQFLCLNIRLGQLDDRNLKIPPIFSPPGNPEKTSDKKMIVLQVYVNFLHFLHFFRFSFLLLYLKRKCAIFLFVIWFRVVVFCSCNFFLIIAEVYIIQYIHLILTRFCNNDSKGNKLPGTIFETI